MSRKNRRQISRTLSTFTPRVAEFKPDYSTIRRDLRRIAILAGSFILVLVVLAIFQNQLLAAFIK